MGIGHKDKDGNFHPHSSGKGRVSEKDLNISQNGNNDTIIVKPSKTTDNKNKRETIMYENRNYEIITKEIDEDGVEAFIDGYVSEAKRNNPKGRITTEKSIEIQKEKLPEKMNRGYLFTVGDVLHGGELLILDQFWVFEDKNKKYTIARI